eukprot:495461_1
MVHTRFQIMTEKYCPTVEDYLKCRVRTTGFIEYQYEFRENNFTVYDVGGARNERQKWCNVFGDISCVIFISALNHYCDVLWEAESKNGMHESIELFTQLYNTKWLRKSEMILWLNKNDLFRQKLKSQISLSVCFDSDVGWNGKQWNGPNYKPIVDDPIADKKHFENCYEAAIKFINDIFISVNQFQNRVIFCHVASAVEQNDVVKIWWDIQNIIIRSNLRRGSVMT